jgi:2-oxoglutarate ferredoxin oxidoreductase subunit alpha
MKYNILFGGRAGQGPNILTSLLAEALIERGFYVFYSRDYQSLIRGGHNFNVLTFSDKPIFSNESSYDLIVALDNNTEIMHVKKLKENGKILKGMHTNMYFAGSLFKIFGFDFRILEKKLKQLGKKFAENDIDAKNGYEDEKFKINLPEVKENKKEFYNGNQGIANGAVNSGLEVYYAYPMTPATPILDELASSKKVKVIELENEIAVINAGIGSSIVGAKAMIGTSGGGFDLMTEGLSLTGIAEVPLVVYLSQRPGPATGVATYTAQGDLNLARHAGHGEFSRVIIAPGDAKESSEAISQCFYFSQKFKIPTILLGDKHFAESYYSFGEVPKIIKSAKSIVLKRFNSYETDTQGCATEDAEQIKKNVLGRLEKGKNIIEESKKFERIKIYGNKSSQNIVLFWGSTKGAVIDSIAGLDVCALQILWIEPFAEEVENLLKGKNIILVENNSTAQLAGLIKEKTGITIEDKNKILRFDGRPFLSDELKEKIKERMR